jgi:hypothetical protein
MKKLVEIPFNHELIGKEGIVVKQRNGETCEVFVSKNGISSNLFCPVFAFDSCGLITEHTIEGIFDKDDNNSEYDLIMYEEKEVKEPRVIWVNLYPDNTGYVYPTKESAEEQKMNFSKGTFKFIEVIEGE